jgi:hypothetical protein
VPKPPSLSSLLARSKTVSGGIFSYRVAGESRPDKRPNIARGIEPERHSVGEEAKFIPCQEAIKAAPDGVASTHSFTALPAGYKR